MSSIESQIQALQQSPKVDLFELSAYDSTDPAAIFRFTKGASVTWQGNEYLALPVEIEGFEFSSGGALPRPKIRVSNINQAFSALASAYGYFIGAKITRRQTLKRFIDTESTADPNEELPQQVFYVSQKTSETQAIIEWELSSELDLEGQQYPKRVVVAGTCLWQYRSAECGYTGAAVAKIDDTATAILAEDVCGKRLTSCKLRFGANGPLRFGGFPGASSY